MSLLHPQLDIARPSALACTECRRKHMKCDANSPHCTRCQTHGLRCRYEPSRRGLKKRAHHHISSSSLGSLPARNVSQRREPAQIVWDSADRHDNLAVSEPSINTSEHPWSQWSLGDCLIKTALVSEGGRADAGADVLEDDDLLVSLFYANFFHAHPFLVPRALYASQNYPSYLKLVVHLIGCHYSGTRCSETMQGLADEALKKAWDSGHRSYVLVQALLLFAIVLHARCIHDRSRSSLSQAVSLALELNMHHRSFGVEHSRNDNVTEEGLVRTWWELYLTDTFIAALDGKSTFRCNSVEADMPLPCEEHLYTGDALLFEPSTMEQFESRIYAKEELQFSSFAYRIEAAQLLARTVAISWTRELHRDQMQNIDNYLAAWPHHLDVSKAEPVDSMGGVDQMLLQAHMLLHYTTMHLHFARSDLVGLLAPSAGSDTRISLLPTYSRSTHGVKAIEAAKRFSDLAALEPSTLKHTPLMLNGILLSSTVQLSAASLYPSRFSEQYRSRLCLTLGILKTLNPVWALARDVSDKVKTMALKVLPHKNSISDQSMSLVDSGINVSSLDAVDISCLSWMDFSLQMPSVAEQSENDAAT